MKIDVKLKQYASKSETIITPTAAATYVFGTQYSIELRRRDTGLLIYFANAAVISLSCNMLGFFCISQLLCRFNTDSVQDTANTHTTPTKLAILLTPCVLVGHYPSTTAHIGWGSMDPPRGRYEVILPQYRVKWPKVGVM